MNIKRLKALKEQMSEEQKRKLLVGLRKFKEEVTGNVGGETDITNADNLQTNENEFTSGDTAPETKVVAKTFDTNSDFDSYVNQRRGIEMTPKERQAIVTEQAAAPPTQATPSAKPTPSDKPNEPSSDEETIDDKIRIQKSITFTDETHGSEILSNFLAELGLSNQRPTSGDKFFMKYEVTDDFGNNTTTVIKKLKEGSQFCWTAFSKYETAEEEGKPEEKEEEV
jgi:hypothetical protein